MFVEVVDLRDNFIERSKISLFHPFAAVGHGRSQLDFVLRVEYLNVEF